MALDESHHRLFCGPRNPPRLVVIDTESGKLIAEFDSVSGIDDLWYDAARQRIYATGSDGSAVYSQKDAAHYTPMLRVPSEPNAATSIWAPEFGRLYVSAPHGGTGSRDASPQRVTGGRDAEILVYEPQR
jgi:hypothetical protein